MKIIALSDIHGTKMNTHDPMGLFHPHGADICLIAGDIAPLHALNVWEKQYQTEWIREKFCAELQKHRKTEFVFVAGNHDFWGEVFNGEEIFWPKNAHYLKNSIVKVKGLTIWGSPVVNPIGSQRRWAFETTQMVQKTIFNKIPKKVDILLTHEPPYIEDSFIDVPAGAIDIETFDPLHLGSKELTKAVERVQPKYLFCGHIHTGDHHRQMIGDTECYNVSVLDESYHYSFYPFQLDVNKLA